MEEEKPWDRYDRDNLPKGWAYPSAEMKSAKITSKERPPPRVGSCTLLVCRWVFGHAEEISLAISKSGPLHVWEFVQDVPLVGGTEAQEAVYLCLS